MKNSKRSTTKLSNSIMSSFEGFYSTEILKSPNKFTKNTLIEFEKIINRVSIAEKSKRLPSDIYEIREIVFRGRLICLSRDCFHLTVSKELANRSICILDSLAKGLENLKFKIRFCEDKNGSYVAAVKDDEYISFHISEGFKYHPIANELRTEYEKVLFRDKEPIPTGKLTLSASARECKINRTWSDNARLIEDALPTILTAFDNLVIKQKQRKVEKAKEAELRRESSSAFKEIEGKKYAEKSIFESAINDTQSFITHKNLEDYLNIVEVEYIKEYGELNEAAYHWLSTARKIANSLSPISNRIRVLRSL